jgi:hypothetical protein
LPFYWQTQGVVAAKYIRHRLYAIAAKVIKTGGKVIIKCQAQYYQLLTKVLNDIKASSLFMQRSLIITFPPVLMTLAAMA